MFCTNCGNSITTTQKFCGSCGTKLTQVDSPSTVQASEPKPFSHYAYIFNSLFKTNFSSLNEVTNFAKNNSEEILRKANEHDPESLLMWSIVKCTEEENYLEGHKIAKLSLDVAEKMGLNLSKFLFGYGFALSEAQLFEEAADALEKSLEIGYGGDAAAYLGRVMLTGFEDLGNAVKFWKIGRDKYGNSVCKDFLDEAAAGDGSYRWSFDRDDGTVEFVMYSDQPGGLGTGLNK